MPSLKRRIARLIEIMSGNLVIPPYELQQLPEQQALQRFFGHFAVDCVFDVGANTGQYAGFLRDRVGFTGPIISFEPIPELAAMLSARAASQTGWFVEALALDSEAGPATFHVMADSQFSSLRAPAHDQPEIFSSTNIVARHVEIKRSILAVELPRWRSRLGFSRPFLKMDTQGNDLAVVRGGGAAISAFVGLQSELPVWPIYEGAANYLETLAAYQELGFRLTSLVPSNAGHFPMMVDIDCIMYRVDADKD